MQDNTLILYRFVLSKGNTRYHFFFRLQDIDTLYSLGSLRASHKVHGAELVITPRVTFHRRLHTWSTPAISMPRAGSVHVDPGLVQHCIEVQWNGFSSMHHSKGSKSFARVLNIDLNNGRTSTYTAHTSSSFPVHPSQHVCNCPLLIRV